MSKYGDWQNAKDAVNFLKDFIVTENIDHGNIERPKANTVCYQIYCEGGLDPRDRDRPYPVHHPNAVSTGSSHEYLRRALILHQKEIRETALKMAQQDLKRLTPEALHEKQEEFDRAKDEIITGGT